MASLLSKLLNSQNAFLIKTIVSYFKVHKKALAVAGVAMGIGAASNAALAYLVQPALDKIFISKDQTALRFIPFLIVVVVGLDGLFSFLQKYLMNSCAFRVLEKLQNELYEKIIRLPVGYFNESQVGMLMSRILIDVRLIGFSVPSAIRIIRDVATIFGLVGLVIYRDPFMAFWALLVFPVAVYPIGFFGKKLRRIGRKAQKQIATISATLQETFSGLSVIKAFATEPLESARFQAKNATYVDIAIRGKFYSLMSSPIMDCIGAVGAGLVIWYGGNRVISGALTAGEFFSFLAALFMLYRPIKSINEANIDIQNALAGAERVFEILRSPDLKVEVEGDTELVPPFQRLEFDRVTFNYPGTSQPALTDISLDIGSGERVALVGPSGSGKTTLVNLIPRFFDVQAGQVRLNGRPVSEYTLSSLRRCIGIVSQDPFLFNTTIRENIAYGREDANLGTVQDAARAAYAHDFVSEFPEGYDTVIGERGVKLSGGQKQRLTIARALLKNPPLLILDEATSSLDTESERIVQQALENLMRNRTSIVIAHRLSTVLSADRIVVMAKGRIQAMGRHEELLEKSPLYAKLYQMQFQDSLLDNEG